MQIAVFSWKGLDNMESNKFLHEPTVYIKVYISSFLPVIILKLGFSLVCCISTHQTIDHWDTDLLVGFTFHDERFQDVESKVHHD